MKRELSSASALEKLQTDLKRTMKDRDILLAAINRPDTTLHGNHMADAADSSVSQQLLLTTLNGKIRALVGSITRYGKKTYGICADCQRPIPKTRLEAHPMAKRCLLCQERHEQIGRR